GVVAATVVIAICYASLVKSTSGNFYVGHPELFGAIFNLVWTSVRDSVDRAGLFGTPQGAHVIQVFILPVVTLFLAAASAVVFWRKPERRTELAPVLMLLVALAGLIAAHYAAGLNYPIDRLGLYLVMLFGLAWAIASSAAGRFLPAANALFAVLLIL